MNSTAATSQGVPAPEVVVRGSPGLAAFLAAVRATSGCRMLDLGPALPVNFAIYSTFARAVRFVDLLRGARELPERVKQPPILTTEAVTKLLAGLDAPYHGILLWDALDYLGINETRVLVERLARCSGPGTRLFALVSATHRMSSIPLRFEILDAERLAYRAVSSETCASPELPPAEVERRIAPFRAERVFLLRHGVREYVGVL